MVVIVEAAVSVFLVSVVFASETFDFAVSVFPWFSSLPSLAAVIDVLLETPVSGLVGFFFSVSF